MAIRAIVFDIGGVLELTPDLEVAAKWERRLDLAQGELNKRLGDIWQAGSVGAISEKEVHRRIGEATGMKAAQVDAFMQENWWEYLGTLNTEMAEYFRGLRPQYQTAILSNSFVGAREKELELYHFDALCDFIIYSHEVGMTKPDPRIYALTCERLGCQPAETLFLDDRRTAVEGACQAGLHGILFQSNSRAIADIQAGIGANDPATRPGADFQRPAAAPTASP